MKITTKALRGVFFALSVWGIAFSSSVATATPITFSFSGGDLLTSSTMSGSLTFDDSLLSGASPVLVSQSGFTGFNFVTTAPLSATWELSEIKTTSAVAINTTLSPSAFLTGVNFAAEDTTTGSFLTFVGNSFTTSAGGTVTGSYLGSWATSGGSAPAPIPNPEPGTIILLGSGLVGVFLFRKNAQKS